MTRQRLQGCWRSVRPSFQSLQWRVLWVTWVGMAVALVVVGVTLHHLFAAHVQRQFQAELSVHLEQLIARLEFDAQGQPMMEAAALSDPRWLKPLSGRYWQIDAYPRRPANEGAGTAWLRSRSLWDEVLHLPLDVIADGSTHQHTLIGPAAQTLLALETTIRSPAPQSRAWTLIVAADARDTHAAITAFAQTLMLALGVLLALLGLASAMQVGVGLSPLRALQHAVTNLEQGQTPRVQGQFPAEIQPLVDSFNRTLQRQEAGVSRARTQAGNLAHALKTPLAVMRHCADQLQALPPPQTQPPDPEHYVALDLNDLHALGHQLHEQVDQAQRHIDWHLRRARYAAHAAAGLRPRCAVLPVVQGLQRVMAKVHAERHLHLRVDGAAHPADLRVEQEDLHDILGNLIDNACKWAYSHVHIHLSEAGDVTIDDDGPGVPEAQRPHLGQRGQRLDEHTPGSGLGLAIACELVDLYEAQLHFEHSPLGGLRVRLTGFGIS